MNSFLFLSKAKKQQKTIVSNFDILRFLVLLICGSKSKLQSSWKPPGVILVIIAIALCGCTTTGLNSARRCFYQGDTLQAKEELRDNQYAEKDRVLYLMERGAIYQASQDYKKSSQDFIEASNLLSDLETYSVSKGSASMVINDSVQPFKGAPFERTLLHTLTALNHLAVARWNDAGVEARRIIQTLDPEIKKDYPDDAFSRYVAGFSLELIDDPSNAALQYRKAAELSSVQIDEHTGFISVPDQKPARTSKRSFKNELISFILIGRSPRGHTNLENSYRSTSPVNYVDVYHQGIYLGRSYNLANTYELSMATDVQTAIHKTLKTVSRVAVKETIADVVEKQSGNSALGDVVRLVLVGMLERPDIRRWETLPHLLQVVRVPCPDNLSDYKMVYRDGNHNTLDTVTVSSPLTKHRHKYVSFCRITQ